MLIIYSDKNYSFGCLNSFSVSLRLNVEWLVFIVLVIVVEEGVFVLVKKSKMVRMNV